jgi:serine/threonine-protein kinase HipA
MNTNINRLKPRLIYVYGQFEGGFEPSLVGLLETTVSRGKELFSFSYEESWLSHSYAQTIDPEIYHFSGKQYAPIHRRNFGVFLDSSPDRWGRFLMDRREGLLAREEGRPVRKLLESDYLLGVYDEHRVGALRFKLDPKKEFLDNRREYASPPWASLRELEAASLALESEDAEKDKNYGRWLNMLIAPGGSLGGARPKASVIDESGHLWIAKFPSRLDEYDIAAWEMLTHLLAKKAGISVPEARLEKFYGNHHTFLTRRFDRGLQNQRLYFSSAMTLLQHSDGDDASYGVSYLELLEFILKGGAKPQRDLEELWRRIIFNICVSNTDDHLRNHGFILERQGWVLSPAFDLNPNPLGDGLKLNISETDNSQDLNLARDVAPLFRLNSKQVETILCEVRSSIRTWQFEAEKLGIPKKEQLKMKEAFRLA